VAAHARPLPRLGGIAEGKAVARHIGIVGCSAEGAALCYRTICVEGSRWLGPYAHPQVSMHTHSLAEYVERLERGDLAGVAGLMRDSAARLVRAGAELLICPDNTIHQAFDQVVRDTPAEWLHIAEVVAAAARSRGYRRAAVLGTRWLVESRVYPDALENVGIGWSRPSEGERQELDRIIMTELVHGQASTEAAAASRAIIERLRRDGCDAAILGCTELPLLLDDGRAALPTLDSTRLLAREALRRAVDAPVRNDVAMPA